MIGEQLGPYLIDAELGSGGMGTVYRATGPEGTAALKIVHPHLLATPGFFKRFLREAEIGKAVRHANVVRTLDVDAQLLDGQQVNYMVLEYVEGKSLRELLQDLGTIPETLLREIALQTAAGLAAIHEAGIVHRDLKPENILITDDHEIRIMDLGVAKLQEASIAITKEGQFAGSVLYAAPEQFRSDEVGPPADLYSLGVLLYELATGGNPFRRDDAAAVIEAHLHHVPPRITDHDTDTTRYFAELVACLLAKRPADRFASAQALHDVLAQAERSTWWTERAPKLREGVVHLPRIRVRRETKLHGREDDLATLRAAWERARGGEGNTVLVEGEAGIGKTRFVDAFLHDLAEADVHVLYGSYPPSGGLGGISDAILGKFGEIDLAAALAPYLTVTPNLVPAFAALVKHEAPPAGAEPLQGGAMHAVCVHLMRALAGEKPLIWIVEDLHFASRESRDTVLSLARAVEGHRVLLVCTARPGVPEEELAHFARLESFQRVRVARLGARDVVQLLQDAFRSEALADRLAAKIALKSDGVPFFVFGIIQGLKEGQFIRQLPDGSYVQTQVIDEIEVPSAVKDLIEGRLNGLSEQQRMVLDVGAVQGMTFDPGLVASVLEEKRVRVLQVLAEIERRFGLVRDEGESVRFDQNQIQEVIYQGLTPHLRTEYHTLLAAAHAERCGENPQGEDAVFLASHSLLGSRPQSAMPLLGSALDHLEGAHRSEEATTLTTRALAVRGLLEGSRRAEVLLRAARSYGHRGQREPERTALNEAVALAAGPQLLRAKRLLAAHLGEVGESEKAAEVLGDTLVMAQRAGEREEESRCAYELGRVLNHLARCDDALREFNHARTIACEISDRESEMWAIGGSASSLWRLGRHGEAKEQFERALAMSHEREDREAELTFLHGFSGFHIHTGRFGDALPHLEAALRVAIETGNRPAEGTLCITQGWACFELGEYEQARILEERGITIATEVAGPAMLARANGNLGRTLQSVGDPVAGLKCCHKHIEIARGCGDRRAEAGGNAYAAEVLRSLGRPGEALEHFRTSLAIASDTKERWRQAWCRGRIGALLAMLGDREEGQRSLELSVETAREIGSRELEAWALGALGSIRRDEQQLREALARHRELRAQERVAATLCSLGAYEEALGIGRRIGHVDTIAVAAAHLGERELHEGTGMEARMEAEFALGNIEEACTLLRQLRDRAPEEYRHSMLENVPLHRDIMKAWEEHREKG